MAFPQTAAHAASKMAAAAGQITETEAEPLDALINARAAIPAPEKPTQRRVGSRPCFPLPQWNDVVLGPPQGVCRPHWQHGSPLPSKAFSP